MELYSFLKKKVKVFSSEQVYLRHDKEQKQIAEKAVEAILSKLPTHRLDSNKERQIEIYAKEKLGSIRYAPWLKAYAVYQGEFKEGWIPDNYFHRYVLPLKNGFHSSISDLRHLAKRILKADEMPDLGYFVRGCLITVDDQLMNKVQVKDYFFSKTPQVILKTNSSMRGQGFYRLTEKDFDVLDESKMGDFVVQLPIHQHEWYSRFSPDSVATLRITTVKSWGKPAKKMAAFMRFGRDGVDRVSASSRLVVGVSTDGCLGRFSLDSDWNLLEYHPDSKIGWEGEKIPDFDQMVKKCEVLHDLEATMGIIGWDLVMDQSGKIQLMEWNTGYPGVVHSEMTTGPNFLETDWSDLLEKSKAAR